MNTLDVGTEADTSEDSHVVEDLPPSGLIAVEFDGIRDLPGVLVPDLDVPCEVNRVHPCLISSPQPAEWIVKYVDCDCDPDEMPQQVVAYCGGCLRYQLSLPQLRCTCGTVYVPPEKMFEDAVRLPK